MGSFDSQGSLKKNKILNYNITVTDNIIKHYILYIQNWSHSTVQVICMNVSSNFRFPFVTIVEKFFFVVQELFMSFSGEFKIRTFNDSIYRARFLAESTVDALCHINIVSGSTPWAISSLFCFNSDCLEKLMGYYFLWRKTIYN